MSRQPINLRVAADDLAEIDRLARASGLTRTEFMVRSALGQITDAVTADSRFEAIEERLDRLERMANLTY